MHEIVSIQCGTSANFLGTHFWNQQSENNYEDLNREIDTDVLFSPRSTPRHGTSYTPRVLLYDRPKNYGSMKRINDLFEESSGTTPDHVMISTNRVKRHPYQMSLDETGIGDGSKLSEDNVRFWSDYNSVFFRPESYLPVQTSGLEEFKLESFDSGVESFQDRDKRLDILDTDLRPFLEECDLLQGINFSSCLTTAWSGFASELLQQLSAELPKACKFVYSTEAAHASQEYINLSQAMVAMKDVIDLFIPFSSHKPCSWSGSAKAADWLDTFMVPACSRTERFKMRDYTTFMIPGHSIFSGALGENLITSTKGTFTRELRIEREHKLQLSSHMFDARLVTNYRHPVTSSYSTTWPVDAQDSQRPPISLFDSHDGVSCFLTGLQKEVERFRSGQTGYARKELLTNLADLHELYEDSRD